MGSSGQRLKASGFVLASGKNLPRCQKAHGDSQQPPRASGIGPTTVGIWTLPPTSELGEHPSPRREWSHHQPNEKLTEGSAKAPRPLPPARTLSRFSQARWLRPHGLEPTGSPSTGLSRQEHGSGLPLPSLRDLSGLETQHVSPVSPALVGMCFTTGATWGALTHRNYSI